MKEEIQKRIDELKKEEQDTYFSGNIQDDIQRRLKLEELAKLLWLFS